MKKLFLLILLLINGFVQAQTNTSNILINHDNNPIDFTKINEATIKEAVTLVIKSSDEKIKKIVAVKNQSVFNILVACDNLQYEISDLSMKLGLISSTFSNDAIRNTTYEESEKLSVYSSGLSLNEPLYKALKRFSTNKTIKLSSSQRKFITEGVLSYEKNGMKLSLADRKPLEQINNKLIKFGNQFDKNINDSKDSLEVNASDLKGIDDETLNSWKRPNGKYMIYVNGPNVQKIGENAENASIRKTFATRYNNRAYPQNIVVLDSLLFYRNRYANKLGFKSYAAFALVDKMAEKPETVWAFENDLIAKLKPLVTDEVKALKAFKKETSPTESDTLYSWDFSYYSKKMLNAKYQLDTDEVKEYFEMNNTIAGMFKVYENLLGINIKPVSNMPVWDAKVKTFEMWSDGKKIGSFYLDLFPRPNKYTHFACFPISQYLKNKAGETLPQAALICNFPEGTANEPSLLEHDDVNYYVSRIRAFSALVIMPSSNCLSIFLCCKRRFYRSTFSIFGKLVLGI